MNRLRICFVAILLLICGVGLSAQEPAKPDLIYEFGKFPCDGFRGNIDILIAELRENPESDAIVVNIGRGKYEVWTTLRGEMIRNHIAYRGFDASRIGYSREVGDEFKTQFFRIPAGKMKTAPASRNYVLTSLSEPYVIEDYDFDDLCHPSFIRIFSRQ